MEERAARLERNNRYTREVENPVRKTRENGVSGQEIKAFQKAHKDKMKAENPTPKSDGKGKRYKFATATKRTSDGNEENVPPAKKAL